MRKPLLGAVAALLLAGGVGLVGAPAASAFQSDGYIVVYKDGVNADFTTSSLERSQGFTSSHRYSYAFRGFAARLSRAAYQRLDNDPSVAFITPDRVVSASPATVPIAARETVPTGVRRMGGATTTAAHPASGVSVAVIDTGIDIRNTNINFADGVNCVRPRSRPNDDNGHGTHVAGTVGGRNNGAGVIGVAPNTRIYSVKVLNSQGSGTISQVICGIDWVAANSARLNIKVANMSLGGPGSNDNNCGNTNGDAFHLAICRATTAGVTFVVAAGNSNVDIATQTPASYPEVLTVTAIADSDGAPGKLGAPPSCRRSATDDSPADFSNYATAAADRNHTIAAPGVCILSDARSRRTTVLSGTSMAAPHVAAAAALCMNNGGTPGPCNGMSPAQVVQKLRDDAAAQPSTYGFTGDPNNSPGSKYYGHLVSAATY